MITKGCDYSKLIMKSFPSREQGHTQILREGMSGHTRPTHTVGYTDGFFYIISTNEQSRYVLVFVTTHCLYRNAITE